jgi:hypothetical protein
MESVRDRERFLQGIGSSSLRAVKNESAREAGDEGVRRKDIPS